jgi:glycosyltransferase involved in cell wall biosynthesis
LALYENFIALNSDPSLAIPTNMFLNLDDPTYTKKELVELSKWESKVISLGFQSTIVCTSEYIRKYLESNNLKSNIYVIPQGHSNLGIHGVTVKSESDGNMHFVYISPTIDVKGDPNEGHNMWDASPLLLEVWPRVSSPNARLHLIGRLGPNAAQSLKDKRIQSHGLLSIEECSKILPNFDVALYPRVHDNGWLPQKLIEYLGAHLPILAFKLIDTQIVSQLNIGLLVEKVDEFANAIDLLCENGTMLTEFKSNCAAISEAYSWKSLAQQYEDLFY